MQRHRTAARELNELERNRSFHWGSAKSRGVLSFFQLDSEMTSISAKWIIASALIRLSTEAFFCKLTASAYDLAAYLAKRSEDRVVFVGRATSIEVFNAGPRVRAAQRITFTTSKWWRGIAKATVIAEAFVRVPQGTSCDGNSDFSVGPDEDWLIVGYASDGVVGPSRLLSRHLDTGTVPPDLLRILERNR